MREGVSRDGRPLFPMMPYPTYAAALDDDSALAIIAYLRTLKPIKNNPGRFEVAFPISMFVRAAPKPVATPAPPPPSPTDTLARGQWLLKVGSCNDCHDSVNERHEPLPGKTLAGGQPFYGDYGVVYTANITSDKATGIGAYSDEDILRVLRQGIGKAGRPLYGMPWPYYKGLSDDDKRALVAALRTVTPVSNIVPAAVLKK
ncbi:MAG: hypothetical protein EXR72_01040 [Myxococcales bacterium]|nr:hypothetical protein [Myxococcales bacterium]